MVTATDTGGRVNTTSSPFFRIDCSPPDIISLSPSGNVVLPDANVTVLFNESMNMAATQNAFDMWKMPDWTPVAGIFSWTSNLMSFNPVSDLDRGSKYQANLSALASDASDPGNTLIGGIYWQFTVASAPPPMVITSNPPNGTVGIAVSLTSITVTFTTGVYIVVGAVNITPRMNFTVESVGIALLITIHETLAPGTNYVIRLNATRISDVYGNRLDGNRDGVGGDDYTFFIMTTSGTEAPTTTPWILVIPLVAIGFMVPLILYFMRSREDEDGKKRKGKAERAKSRYEGTIGPQDQVEGIEPEDRPRF